MKTAKTRAYAIPNDLKGGSDSEEGSSKHINDTMYNENSDSELRPVPEQRFSSLTIR